MVGREKELIVLRSAWGQALAEGPQLCVLRGESGFGKTRLVQAFYSWLSGIQSQPRYWPDQLLRETNNLCLNPPPSDFGHGIEPPWIWWGARWPNPEDHNLGELSRCALIDSLHHLTPHRAALQTLAQRRKRLGKVALEVLSSPLDALTFGMFGPGKTVVELWMAWREERSDHREETSSLESRQEAVLQAQIDSLLDDFKALLTGDSPLPVVLVLDDAHWMDVRSLDFVERLLTAAHLGRWPLMLIATHWEQDWNLQAADGKNASFAAVYARVTALLERAGPRSGSAFVLDIDKVDGLSTVLEAELPGLAPSQVTWLCERADGNPRLLAEIILELQGEPEYFEDNDVGRALRPSALQAMERRDFALHAVQRRRFRRLDHRLRQLLGYASHLGMRFLGDLLLDVIKKLESSAEDGAQLTLAVQPYAVLLAEGAHVYEFRHRVFHDLALERVRNIANQGPEIGAALLGVAADWLDRMSLEALSDAEQELFLHLMLAQDEAVTRQFPCLQLRLLSALFQLYKRTGYFGKLRDHADALLSALPPDGRVSIDMLPANEQVDLVYMLIMVDRRAAARMLAEGFLHTSTVLADQFPKAFDYLAEVATAEVVLGDVLNDDDPGEALVRYQRALAIQRRVTAKIGRTQACLDAEQGQLLRLGISSEDCDRRAQAKVWYQKAVALAQRRLDVTRTPACLRDLCSARSRLANLLVKLGEAKKAQVLLVESLDLSKSLVEEFGETPERLRDLMVAQGALGDVLQVLDEPEQASALFQQALNSAEQLVARFGPTAQRCGDVAEGQLRLGLMQLQAGALDVARPLFEQALAGHQQVVDVYGETATRLRRVAGIKNFLGHLLLKMGDTASSRAYLQAALKAHQALSLRYGETLERQRDVSVTQSALGDISNQLGEHDEAIVLYEDSLATMRHLLARFGETPQALQDLIAMQVRVGSLLRRSGQHDEARPMIESALSTSEHLVSAFGASALNLRAASSARYALGELSVAIGDSASGIDCYRAALATSERALSEHGETAERLTDIAMLHDTLGDLHLLSLDPEQAGAHIENALTHSSRALERFGSTPERLRNIAIAKFKMAAVADALGDGPRSRQFLRESEQSYQLLADMHPAPETDTVLAHVRSLLANM